jgi:protein transport protein HofB
VDDEVRALISKNAAAGEIKDCARKNGMLTIFESGIRAVEKGLTSFDEVCRISVD